MSTGFSTRVTTEFPIHSAALVSPNSTIPRFQVFSWLYPVTKHTPQELRAQQTRPTRCTPTYLLGILDVLEVDEGKPSGAPRLLIIHDGNVGNGPILGENLSQVSFCSVQTQPKHSQTTVWIRICLKERTEILRSNLVYLQGN